MVTAAAVGLPTWRLPSNYAGAMVVLSRLPIYWRVCLINGGLFALGTVALVASPATVSQRFVVSEVAVLGIGLAAILLANALLLRSVLAPLDQLRAAMPGIDLLQPGQRLPVRGHGPVAELITSFNTMLDRLETERATSTRRALQAQEAERQRIATELHDEVGQSLTVVLLGLKRALDGAPPQLSEELQLAQETTRTSLEEVRRIAGRLRPGLLEDLGLISALSALATELAAHSKVVDVRRGFAPGLPTLSPEIELVVYRVAQEALTNVARHAHADAVQLTLSRQGDAVALRVADNGVGADRIVPASGIRGMQERATMVGGQLTIGPRVGGGTEVRLLVPISPAPGSDPSGTIPITEPAR